MGHAPRPRRPRRAPPTPAPSAHQMLALSAQGFRCVAYDRRGHGRSSDPGRGYDFDTPAEDLAAVLTALDLRDVTLVGFSMGTGEIVRYLTRHGNGNQDVTSPLELTGRRTAAALPAATLVVYGGAPHGLVLTHTDRFNGDLLSFVRGGAG